MSAWSEALDATLKFQFLIGRLKCNGSTNNATLVTSFQFLIGRLKCSRAMKKLSEYNRFNSL